VSPGIHSLDSDFAKMNIFVSYFDPVKWAKHASWKLLLLIQPSAVVLSV
jgi:hypothetical protein